MELYKDILADIIQKNPELIVVNSEELKNVFDSTCYMALQKIKRILEDDSFNDKECFAKIEEIVSVYECMGSGCDTRHDFG